MIANDVNKESHEYYRVRCRAVADRSSPQGPHGNRGHGGPGKDRGTGQPGEPSAGAGELSPGDRSRAAPALPDLWREAQRRSLRTGALRDLRCGPRDFRPRLRLLRALRNSRVSRRQPTGSAFPRPRFATGSRTGRPACVARPHRSACAGLSTSDRAGSGPQHRPSRGPSARRACSSAARCGRRPNTER